MDLGGVHLPLDDVQQGDVAVVVLPVTRSGHHHILGLEGSVDIHSQCNSAGLNKHCGSKFVSLQWNLQIKDSLGTTILAFVERLSFYRGKKMSWY